MRKQPRKVKVAGSPARRAYSLSEANRSLVLVKRIIGDIVSDYGRLVDLQELLEAAQSGGASDRVETARREIAGIVDKLQRALEELEELRLELKDWSLGVVDFPCVVSGREVRLTWRLGEERIGYWHEVHAPALQPIEALPEERPVAARV